MRFYFRKKAKKINFSGKMLEKGGKGEKGGGL
jgi:hypothetical protein